MPDYTNYNTLFHKIYQDTYTKVFHFIYRLTNKDEQLTDDLVQSCYIRLWETMDSLKDAGHCLPLLYNIAKGLLIDHHRKVLSEQQKLAVWKERQEEVADTTTVALAYKETRSSLDALLSVMPARRKEIFLLCREEGLSHKEIAHRLNISVDSVEQQMNLALKFLRKKMLHKYLSFLLIYF